ncbi:MAG: Sua5 family C-terminal domain-containing protein [Kiritimatiellia bacterium]
MRRIHRPARGPGLYPAGARICANADAYARELFHFFRVCDAAGVRRIACGTVPETGIGLALMDQLRRANVRWPTFATRHQRNPIPAQKPGRKAEGFHYISIWVIRLDNKLTRLRKAGNESSALRRLKHHRPLYNLSAFMQSLKQAMCEWFSPHLPPHRPGVDRTLHQMALVKGAPCRNSSTAAVRYFTDSLAIGTRAVEGVFAGNRSHFGPHRKEGARPLRPGRPAEASHLRALRRSPSPDPLAQRRVDPPAPPAPIPFRPGVETTLPVNQARR